VLLLGFVMDSQFDIDRWLLGLAQANVDVPIYEIPTIPGLVPGMFAGYIDGGMRSGIPEEDWVSVITVYGDGGEIVRFTGNENPRNARVLLLDSKGKVVHFHDRGYSAGTLLALLEKIKELKAQAMPPSSILPPSPASRTDAAVRLIVRADDMGSSHAANVACIRAFKEGIARSVEVMAPTSWFPEAVALLRENPGLDVGVHLTLTSEWDACRWGPLTRAPSLADADGYFFPTTSQRSDFPPGTGFLEAKPKLDEVERELRAQIELCLRKIQGVSHLSVHMGTATATPELKAIVEKLSSEYKLPLDPAGAKHFSGFPWRAGPDEKVHALAQALGDIQPGLWVFVEHPGMDVPEMKALGHEGYRDVAIDRDGVTRAFTSREAKDAIERRGIRLLSYAEALQR
jgi:hypothetical protein